MLLDISSRSQRVNANRERRRSAGRIPPCGATWLWIDEEGLPNARPIALSDSPRCQRSHNSFFSVGIAAAPAKDSRTVAVQRVEYGFNLGPTRARARFAGNGIFGCRDGTPKIVTETQ